MHMYIKYGGHLCIWMYAEHMRYRQCSIHNVSASCMYLCTYFISSTDKITVVSSICRMKDSCMSIQGALAGLNEQIHMSINHSEQRNQVQLLMHVQHTIRYLHLNDLNDIDYRLHIVPMYIKYLVLFCIWTYREQARCRDKVVYLKHANHICIYGVISSVVLTI